MHTLSQHTLTDMGVQVFLDVVRSLTPSHIVRTVPHPVENIPDELPALTPDFLNSAPGLFKVAEVTPYTEVRSASDIFFTMFKIEGS